MSKDNHSFNSAMAKGSISFNGHSDNSESNISIQMYRNRRASTALKAWFIAIIGPLVLSLIVAGAEMSLAESASATYQQMESTQQRIEQHMLQSKKLLEKGEFSKARELSNLILADLDRLVEIAMPLQERITQVLEHEKSILNQTEQAAPGNHSVSDPLLKEQINNLIRDQTANIERTESLSKHLSKQLKLKTARQTNESLDPNLPPETVNAVKQFIEQSAAFQADANSALKDHLLTKAKTKEEQAVTALVKALELLDQREQAESNGQAQSTPQSNQHANNQQPSDNQSQPQTHTKQDQQQEMKSVQSTANRTKRMTAQEASKELQRMRKQAQVEKAAREENYGPLVGKQQIPVEKDW